SMSEPLPHLEFLLPPVPTPRRSLLPPWGRAILFLLVATGMYLLVQVAAAIVLVIGLAHRGGLPSFERASEGLEALTRSPLVAAAVEWATAAAIGCLCALFWILVDRRPWTEFGLTRGHRGCRRIGVGILLGIFPFAITVPLSIATGHLRYEGWLYDSWSMRLLVLAAMVLLSIAIGLADARALRRYLRSHLGQ